MTRVRKRERELAAEIQDCVRAIFSSHRARWTALCEDEIRIYLAEMLAEYRAELGRD